MNTLLVLAAIGLVIVLVGLLAHFYGYGKPPRAKARCCIECGVYFKPREGDYGETEEEQRRCNAHASAWREKYRRVRNVTRWAEKNWERLEEQALKDLEEDGKRCTAMFYGKVTGGGYEP